MLFWKHMVPAQALLCLRTNFRAMYPAHKAERVCVAALWLLITVYATLFLNFAYRRYDQLGSLGFDLAIFDQATWLISRGQTPFVTVRGLHILADHFSVILYLLAPLYWLWDSAKILLTVQIIAVALGALPVYAFARHQTRSAPISLLFAIAYLFYPTLQWGILCEFHPDMLATPLLLAAFYFAAIQNWRVYFGMLALAATTKETIGLTIILLGFYLLPRERRIGCGTIAFGAAALLLAWATVRCFNHGQPNAYFWLYRDYGNTPAAIALHIVNHPFAVAAKLASGLNGDYVFHLLQPIAFLALLAPEALAIALPSLLSNLLSSRLWMHNIYGWYTPSIAPFVIVAAIIGFSRCQRWRLSVVTRGLLIYLSISVVISMENGPFRLHPWPITYGLTPRQSAEAESLLRHVPPDASISAPTVLLPHLSHRRAAYTFPNPFFSFGWGATARALRQQDGEGYTRWTQAQYAHATNTAPVDYVILSPQPLIPIPADIYRDMILSLLCSPAYGIVFMGNETLILQRGADYHYGLRLLSRQSGVAIHNSNDVQKAYSAWQDAGYTLNATDMEMH